MEKKHIDKWRNIRESGCTAWVMKRGILGFGVPMSLFFAIQIWLTSGIVSASLMFFPSALIGGATFGLTTWKVSEWRYYSYEKTSQISESLLKDIARHD